MNNEHLPLNIAEINKTDFNRATFVLDRLGLSFKDLEGKKTLDLGSGRGEVGRAAEKLGYDLVSIDRYPHNQYPHLNEDDSMKVEGKKLKTPAVVQGDARHLPFADGTFDLVISHASPPITWTRERTEQQMVLNDVKRILKKRGEFRFGPIIDDPDIGKLDPNLRLVAREPDEPQDADYYSLTK